MSSDEDGNMRDELDNLKAVSGMYSVPCGIRKNVE